MLNTARDRSLKKGGPHAEQEEKMPREDRAQADKAANGSPPQEAIAKRAYELYLQRGSVPGYELEDWLQAEAELTAAAALGQGQRR